MDLLQVPKKNSNLWISAIFLCSISSNSLVKKSARAPDLMAAKALFSSLE